MKKEVPARERLVTAVSWLCVAGFVAAVVCLLLGFGLFTHVGRIAIFGSFALQVLDLLVIRLRERCLHKGAAPKPSVKMRKFHRVAAWCWRLGAALLTASLVCLVLGHGAGKLWVWLPCLFGAILTPIGWLGAHLSYYRRRQAALYRQNHSK